MVPALIRAGRCSYSQADDTGHDASRLRPMLPQQRLEWMGRRQQQPSGAYIVGFLVQFDAALVTDIEDVHSHREGWDVKLHVFEQASSLV